MFYMSRRGDMSSDISEGEVIGVKEGDDEIGESFEVRFG